MTFAVRAKQKARKHMLSGFEVKFNSEFGMRNAELNVSAYADGLKNFLILSAEWRTPIIPNSELQFIIYVCIEHRSRRSIQANSSIDQPRSSAPIALSAFSTRFIAPSACSSVSVPSCERIEIE